MKMTSQKGKNLEHVQQHYGTVKPRLSAPALKENLNQRHEKIILN